MLHFIRGDGVRESRGGIYIIVLCLFEFIIPLILFTKVSSLYVENMTHYSHHLLSHLVSSRRYTLYIYTENGYSIESRKWGVYRRFLCCIDNLFDEPSRWMIIELKWTQNEPGIIQLDLLISFLQKGILISNIYKKEKENRHVDFNLREFNCIPST